MCSFISAHMVLFLYASTKCAPADVNFIQSRPEIHAGAANAAQRDGGNFVMDNFEKSNFLCIVSGRKRGAHTQNRAGANLMGIRGAYEFVWRNIEWHLTLSLSLTM